MLGTDFSSILSQEQELRQFSVPNSISGEQWGVIRGVLKPGGPARNLHPVLETGIVLQSS